VSEERLQKILARAGVASRRKAEELIREGRVTVNGQPAAIGDKADLAHDSVKLDETRIQAPSSHRYLLLNKPRGVMSTVSDPAGRTTVIDLVPPAMRRALAPVGRLDFQTEGLLLLTDDGDLAQQVAHPSFGCWKTYEVKVRGRPAAEQVERLRAGIVLEGRRTAPCRIVALRRSSKTTPAALRRARAGAGKGGPAGQGRRGRPRGAPESDNASWWSVELGEGRTRQIREMFQRIGHPVQKLRRVAIGPVSDPNLPVGSLRELSEREVAALRKAGPPVRRPAAEGREAAKAGKPRGSRQPADGSAAKKTKEQAVSRESAVAVEAGEVRGAPAGPRRRTASLATAAREPRRGAAAERPARGTRSGGGKATSDEQRRRALPRGQGSGAGKPGRRPGRRDGGSQGPPRPSGGRTSSGLHRSPGGRSASAAGARRPPGGSARTPSAQRRAPGGRAASPSGPRRPPGARAGSATRPRRPSGGGRPPAPRGRGRR
jgi:23S rRNA pseudouridine2605 synthase